eukprot:jgi/Tetstr1/438862/TSEL_027371.t1
MMCDYERRIFEVTVVSNTKAIGTARVAVTLADRGRRRGRSGGRGRGREARLHEAFASDEPGQRTIDLLSSSLLYNTLPKSYAGKMYGFAEFCHDSKNISPLEAATATFVWYVAWIGERG